MERKRQTYSRNRRSSLWQTSAASIDDQLSIYDSDTVAFAPNQAGKFVMLDEEGNLVPKMYHQRKDNFVAFQMYDHKQPDFTE